MLILIASRLVLLLLRCFIRTFFVRRVFGIALLLCRCVMGLLCGMRASSEIISKNGGSKADNSHSRNCFNATYDNRNEIHTKILLAD